MSVEIGCLCEEGNYPCSYCEKLAMQESKRIEEEIKEEQAKP